MPTEWFHCPNITVPRPYTLHTPTNLAACFLSPWLCLFQYVAFWFLLISLRCLDFFHARHGFIIPFLFVWRISIPWHEYAVAYSFTY